MLWRPEQLWYKTVIAAAYFLVIGRRQVSSATVKNRVIALGLLTADLIRLLFDWNLKRVLCVNFLGLDFLTADFSKPINRGTVHDLTT